MPFKHNTARRHLIPIARHWIQNWPAYETGLERRGVLALWLDDAWYSDTAIESVLMLRIVFYLSLRHAEGSPQAC